MKLFRYPDSAIILEISSRSYKFNFSKFENFVLKIEATIYHIDHNRVFT